MKKKIKWMAFLFILIIGAFSAQIGVFADDDDDYEKRGYYEDRERSNYEDDDDDDYEGEEEDEGYYEGDSSYQQAVPKQQGYWNFWMREAVSYQNSELPINEATEVKVNINGKESSLYVIPRNGQILVAGDQLAKLLNIKSDFYPKSRILVLSKNKTELIVRAGSNAAYENKQKTPMPMSAVFIEKSLYLPISVVANAMGYRVSWNIAEQTLILENI
jgi:hypothetical protein